jgi:hypothetical protein
MLEGKGDSVIAYPTTSITLGEGLWISYDLG